MTYIGDSVNSSAVIAEPAGAAITGGQGRAVKYDAEGRVVLCSQAGEAALGVLTMQSGECRQGDDACVQIKDVGLCLSGAAIAKGAQLSVDEEGRLVTATAGAFILGVALAASQAAGELIPVQIAKCGYAPA